MPRCGRWPLWGWLLWGVLGLGGCAPVGYTVPPTLTPWPSVVPRLTPANEAAPPRLALVVVDGFTPLPASTAMTPWVQRLAPHTRRAVIAPGEALVPGHLLAAGTHTAAIGWPGLGPAEATVGVVPVGLLAESALHRPRLEPAQGWEGAPLSFSPRLEARLVLKRGDQEVGAVWVLALDTINDNVAEYDSYLLDEDKYINAASAQLDGRDPPAPRSAWAQLTLSAGAVSSWKLIDGAAASLALYQSPIQQAEVWPETLATQLYTSLGFWPPPPDRKALGAGWITREEFGQMVAQQSRWLAGASALVWRETTPTLLLARWPVEAPQAAPLAADNALAAFLPACDLSDETLFLLWLSPENGSASPGGHWWAAGAGIVSPHDDPDPTVALADSIATAATVLDWPLPPQSGTPLGAWLPPE